MFRMVLILLFCPYGDVVLIFCNSGLCYIAVLS
jgi:hypothetical protein